MPTVAIVGAGLIGRAWAVVFARAGFDVRVFDPDAGQRAAAPELIRAGLDESQRHGLLDDPDGARARVTMAGTLAEAVAGVGLVQENGPEVVEVKRAALRRARPPGPAGARSWPPRPRPSSPRSSPKSSPGRARCLVGASGQPAAPRADRGAVRRALDRAGDDRAGAKPLRERRAGPDRGAPGDRGLHPQPPAGRAARRSVPARRRRRRQPAGPRQDGQGRARPALVVHGAVRDHRPQRAGRHGRLLRALHRLLPAAAPAIPPAPPSGTPRTSSASSRAWGRTATPEAGVGRRPTGGTGGAARRSGAATEARASNPTRPTRRHHGEFPEGHHHLRRHRARSTRRRCRRTCRSRRRRSPTRRSAPRRRAPPSSTCTRAIPPTGRPDQTPEGLRALPAASSSSARTAS